MKKAAPVLIIAVLGLGLGVMIWWVTRTDPVPPTPNDPEQVNVDFKPENFIATFDLNEDGEVTFDEFNKRYGKPLADNSPPLIFHEDNDGPALDAAEAFKRWDRDANKVINANDMQLIENKAWRNFQAEAEKKKLKAVVYGDQWLMLNEHQLAAHDAEVAGLAREELPYAGKFWAERYLGKWVTLVDEKGDVHEGYMSRSETRIFLLTDDARLSAHDPAIVTVTEAPADEPHNLYAAEIRKIKFDQRDPNLELARKCVNWDLVTEGDTLYSRVLIFEPTNEEALNALGLTEKDGHFTEKGN